MEQKGGFRVAGFRVLGNDGIVKRPDAALCITMHDRFLRVHQGIGDEKYLPEDSSFIAGFSADCCLSK